ncbi:hypothetical protein E3J84_03940 [Candidatus Aerophobetes bacterium]|uniref:Uncharacterized protein n=1 Tax=Aerophobetes bacterium TaxID=2030807 RepID=A0A523RXK6_UNCAE|nr:MAG: hypothetical protein E3J84_03940 [Candidatus Aerophobetes bacterium]
MFIAPSYIQQELKAIDPLLFCVWNSRKKRWQIRLWKIAYPMKHYLNDYYFWLKKSRLCHTLCVRNDEYRDVGFRRLDIRAIRIIQESRWNQENPDILAKEVDDHNEKMQLDAIKEEEAISRDCGKRLYHYLQRPTVYLGGN